MDSADDRTVEMTVLAWLWAAPREMSAETAAKAAVEAIVAGLLRPAGNLRGVSPREIEKSFRGEK